MVAEQKSPTRISLRNLVSFAPVVKKRSGMEIKMKTVAIKEKTKEKKAVEECGYVEERVLLEVHGLSKRYSSFSLQDISFSLEAGYILGLTGRNGAGKTTLLKQLIHPETVSGGSIVLDGTDVTRHPLFAKQEIGLLMEDNPFLPEMTLEANGELLGAFYEQFSKEKFYGYLKRFELDRGKKYSGLSRGMRMKFQLAFALAHRPKLLLLDEATGGLDVVFRREFYYLLQEAVEQELVSVIISTHMTEDLDKVADYVAFLENGRLKFCESREGLCERYRTYLQKLYGAEAGKGAVRIEDVIYQYDAMELALKEQRKAEPEERRGKDA